MYDGAFSAKNVWKFTWSIPSETSVNTGITKPKIDFLKKSAFSFGGFSGVVHLSIIKALSFSSP